MCLLLSRTRTFKLIEVGSESGKDLTASYLQASIISLFRLSMGTEEGLSSSNHKNVTAGVNNKINLNNDNGSNNGGGAVAAVTGTGATTKPKKTRAEKRERRREKKREEKKERGDGGGGGGGGGAGLGPGVEKLKTVVRRLPPNLPEDVFWESVKPWATDETTAWRAYYKGKIRKK